jgi:hypothetical protein
MSVVEGIVAVLALVAAGGASVLVFRAEGRKAFWYLLMAIGFGMILIARILIWIGADESGASLRMIGMIMASFSYVGSLWSRIREQVYLLLVRTGILKGPEDAKPQAPAETGAEPEKPAASVAPEPAERTVETPPPFDLPPSKDAEDSPDDPLLD